MTLYEIVDILKKIALDQPNIRSASDGSVYDKMNTNPSVQYDVFHISQTNHQEDFETDYYGLQLFYISRLEDSLEDNRLQIQSIGKEILGNVIRTFCENFAIDYPTITYIPFTQKFNDLTAGVYCNVRLEVPKDLVCADDYYAEVVPGSGLKLQDIGITITENGLRVITADAEYDGIGEIRIETNVPQSTAVLQDKEVEYTENGSYSIHPDPAYDGLSSVSVDVLVPDNYDEGYDDGKRDGENEQKAKLTVTSFTENNTYTRENGWSAVTVDVPQTGQTINNQNKYPHLQQTDFRLVKSGDYYMYQFAGSGSYHITYDSGYTGLGDIYMTAAISLNEPIAIGENQQKAKMSALTVTANGEYNREDGWSAITVTVPQTGSSNEDLIANLQGDYYLIPYGTTHLRDYAFYYTCFSSITIPDTVVAIGPSAFAYNQCLTSITIPDSVQSLGGNAFYRCTNLQTAILGNGISQLEPTTFYNCRSLTGITIPSGITEIGNNCFGTCSGLTEMTFEGLTPPTIDTGSSLGNLAYTFPIYVPCQSIDAYKTAFGTAYAPRIQCKEEPQPTGDTAITAITLVVDSAITDSGTATTEYSPIDAPTDIYYTSSDPNIATIDSETGVITVIADGTVTICAIDRISGLQDCKSITVTKSEPSLNMPLTMHIVQAGNIVWKTTDASFATTIQYKKNDGNWTNITATTGGTSIPVVSGDTVWFRGNNAQYSLGQAALPGYAIPAPYNTFCGTTAGFELSNNIMSLVNANNFANLKTFQSAYTFCGLFDTCSGLTNAENLLMPATALTNYCYCGMFFRCTNLVSSPSLPATIVATACYEGMFQYCTSLSSVPSILPATTLQSYCYSWMFMNCSNLTTAPELPANNLVSNSYLHMFDNCSRLQTIKCLATNISPEHCTDGWVSDVAATGTFTKASTMSSWTRGDNGIPTGWTVVNNS